MQLDLEKIKVEIESELGKELISSRILLDQFNFIDESSRKTSSYVDPRYIPFYFYLGRLISPKSLMEIGFGIGLCSGVFFKGCKSVENFFGFQETNNNFYSSRIGRSNIRQSYKKNGFIYGGKFGDDEFNRLLGKDKFDLIFVNEECSYDTCMSYLEISWQNLNLDGLLVVDYTSSNKLIKKAYCDFCKIKNRKEITIKTRYGIGLIQK